MERQCLVAKGRSDERIVVMVPEVEQNKTVGITLLHVRLREQMEAGALRSVLGGYRNRYAALSDAVTEIGQRSSAWRLHVPAAASGFDGSRPFAQIESVTTVHSAAVTPRQADSQRFRTRLISDQSGGLFAIPTVRHARCRPPGRPSVGLAMYRCVTQRIASRHQSTGADTPRMQRGPY
jgi:hypothetical protein